MRLTPVSTKFTSTIAQRDLVLAVQGRRSRVRIRIGQPVQDVDTAGGFDWRCPVEISRPGNTLRVRGFGVDSLQALVDAFKVLEHEIRSLENRSSGQLLWFDEPWHGIPRITLAMPKLTTTRRPNKALQPTSRAERKPRSKRL
jgi:hypothetical protein